MRFFALVVLRAALVLGLLAAPFAAPRGAAGADGGSVTTRKIGPGAYYKKIVKPWKKWVIHAITVDLDAKSTIDVALAGNELGNVEVLSSLAGRKGAIAAINGDFGSHERRPWNTYAEDGHFIQTERTWGRALAVNAPETQSFIGHPVPRIKLTPKGAPSIKVARVNNERPGEKQVGLYTRFARRVEDTPGGTCSARLMKKGPRRLNEYGSVQQVYEVVAVRCASDPMRRYKGIVVSATRTGTRKEEIKALVDGQRTKLTWSLAKVDQTLDVIGGNPMIVEDGKVLQDVVSDCGYLCRLHPRSAVGIKPGNKLMFVVIDGRRENARGMYLNELARWFVSHGAQRAMTFDGGGAAEMWIKGEVVNTPSDGHERPVLNALLLLPGADADPTYPPPTPASSTSASGGPLAPYITPTSEDLAQQTFEDSAADPGSLGGLADYLSRRGEDIPPWMERIARELRANER